ncbi:E3 ubiquitin-protein ligase UHRF1-like [Trichogramma pretiosum]|uniref:E3 ubiquitin-protein ligase UHRF1-like n=1 Tax=Trichogramma pretiosum TaxID=7493 RepID=UPI0006C99A67|nr:E3 ubiquitin-protein ligase UHRF1-like [Trichogramma pretiosum]
MRLKYVTSDWEHEGEVEVYRTMTISDLKMRVARQINRNLIGIPATRIILTINHELYKDHELLKNCNIKSDDEIRVIIKPVGKQLEFKKMGSIKGIEEGALFWDRAHLAACKVHTPTQPGISGDSLQGANSVVLSGGYEYDCDFRNVIFYTGSGGRTSGEQTENQTLTRGNKALAMNCKAPYKICGRIISSDYRKGVPIRVVRQVKLPHTKPNKSVNLYSYDGIYRVYGYWPFWGTFITPAFEIRRFILWHFCLVKDGVDQNEIDYHIRWYDTQFVICMHGR